MKRHEKPPTGAKPVPLPRKFPLLVKVGRSKTAVVRIYRGKSGGYDLFTVAYRVLPGGPRKRIAFGTFDDALSRAKEVADDLALGEADLFTLTSAERASYCAAMALLKPFGVPLHAAVEEYVAARRRRTGIDASVADIVAELLGAKEQDGLSARYLETLRSHLNRFAAVFKDSKTSIADVTSRLIIEWLASLNVGIRARNNIRMSVITLFHFARSRGYLPKGQSTEADDVPKGKERGGKIGILTPEQMATIMKKATAERSIYFALGGFAGLRRAEIERLEWSDFNFERGHITVGADKAKTATRRLVPIQPNLMQWLARSRGRTGHVFGGRRSVGAAIAAAVKHLKKKWPGMEWPDNALRHSYATYRLAAIADSGRVALEMGNSVAKLMTNYRELADAHDAKLWFSIGPKRPGKARDRDIIQMTSKAA